MLTATIMQAFGALSIVLGLRAMITGTARWTEKLPTWNPFRSKRRPHALYGGNARALGVAQLTIGCLLLYLGHAAQEYEECRAAGGVYSEQERACVVPLLDEPPK